MSETIQTGLELILSAAKAHGENSEPDHEVGDLQAALRCAWGLMTPGQRAALLRDGTVAEQLENELPESVYGLDVAERIDAAVDIELQAAAVGQTIYDRLVAAFPGFIEDDSVDGADLVDWVSENLETLKATRVGESADGYIELVVTMRSKTTGGEDSMTIRVWEGQDASQVAASAAEGYGAQVISVAKLDGTPI